MRLRIGTSGFAYEEWIGPFYPHGIRKTEMLPWYASQLETVEINNTFYRFPTVAGLAAWADHVPENFLFAIKVPRRITHIKRLHDVREDVEHLVRTVKTLGKRLGPMLFQFPPRMPLNVRALAQLTAQLPRGLHAAFEFRDASWLSEPVYDLLAERSCALCFNDAIMTAPRPTTDWGYVRLRRERYDRPELEAVTAQVLSQPWSEAFVYVKHESPDSPRVARDIAAMQNTGAPAGHGQ